MDNRLPPEHPEDDGPEIDDALIDELMALLPDINTESPPNYAEINRFIGTRFPAEVQDEVRHLLGSSLAIVFLDTDWAEDWDAYVISQKN